MSCRLGWGFVVSAAVLAVACNDSYGGNDANPPHIDRPAKVTATDAGADAAKPGVDTTPADDAGTNDAGPTPTDDAGPNPTARALEVSAYYAGYTQSTLPAASVAYGALDEITHFAVVPHADGTLDDSINVVDLASATALTAAAAKAHVHATLCIGGQGSATGFAGAMKDHQTDFVKAIVKLATDRGYTGVDVDWEPLASSDAAAFQALVAALRAGLPAGATLSAAAPVGSADIVKPAATDLDRVHLMAYDLSGPYPGWVTWHNGALFNGGHTFPSTGAKLPAASDAVSDFIAAGVPAAKLMLGIDHIGYAWKGGVTAPLASWTAAPTYEPVPYRTIADTLITTSNAKWDDEAKVPFLSIDTTGDANDQFVSYEDERSQGEKVKFARDSGLAGVFVWDLSASYRPSQAKPSALVQSLHDDAKAIATE